MKIAHLSDIHYRGDTTPLRAVREYLQAQRDIDLVAITGDLLIFQMDKPTAQAMNSSLNDLAEFLREYTPMTKDGEEIPIGRALRNEKFLSELKFSTGAGKKVNEAAATYSKVLLKFDNMADKMYGELVKEIERFSQPVVIIPGNWDSTNYFKFFEDRDLHLKVKKFSDVEIAGYGGANSVPAGLPPTRAIPFDEEQRYRFLDKTNPEIVMTHMPPYSLLDNVEDDACIGGQLLFALISRQCPNLVLCGHRHDAEGSMKDEKYSDTVIVNAGNFGAYPRDKQSGLFKIIEANKDFKEVRVIPKRVINGIVY